MQIDWRSLKQTLWLFQKRIALSSLTLIDSSGLMQIHLHLLRRIDLQMLIG